MKTMPFFRQDITDRETFNSMQIGPDDMVINNGGANVGFDPTKVEAQSIFWPVGYIGDQYLLEDMSWRNCSKLIQFTTDIVYSYMIRNPQDKDYWRTLLGPYGENKSHLEQLCES